MEAISFSEFWKKHGILTKHRKRLIIANLIVQDYLFKTIKKNK